MKTPIDPRDIQYYFEALERDTIDREGRSRRSSEVLNIRDKLLALPDQDFNNVVKTIKTLLNPNGNDGDNQQGKSKRKDASELYEKARIEKPMPLKMGSV